MALDQKQLEQFAKLLGEAVIGVHLRERGSFFSPNYRTHSGVSYLAPEESDLKIDKVVIGLNKKFGAKYTLEEIHKDIRQIFAARLKDQDHDLISDLRAVTDTYEAYNTQQVLVRRISGVELSNCSIKFGRVLVVPIGEQLNSIATELTEKIFSEGKRSQVERAEATKMILDVVSEEFEAVTGQFQINNSVACVAEYTATPARALERSQEEIEFIIDLLRYFGVATQAQDVRIDFTELYPSKNTVAFVTSGRAVSLQPTKGKDDHATLRLGPDALEKLENLGVFQLADYFSARTQHGLKKAISRALHWFALACVQRDKANKILLYITALESIFHRYGKEKIADCCAFLLGIDPTGRSEIAEAIKDFYLLRNKFAHGSSAAGVENYRELRYLTVCAICAALERTSEFDTADALSRSFDTLKFALPSDGIVTPNCPEGTD